PAADAENGVVAPEGRVAAAEDLHEIRMVARSMRGILEAQAGRRAKLNLRRKAMLLAHRERLHFNRSLRDDGWRHGAWDTRNGGVLRKGSREEGGNYQNRQTRTHAFAPDPGLRAAGRIAKGRKGCKAGLEPERWEASTVGSASAGRSAYSRKKPCANGRT